MLTKQRLEEIKTLAHAVKIFEDPYDTLRLSSAEVLELVNCVEKMREALEDVVCQCWDGCSCNVREARQLLKELFTDGATGYASCSEEHTGKDGGSG